MSSPSLIEADVEGMHHPIVGSEIGHLPPILVQAVKRCVGGIPVQEVIPFPGCPDDDGRRIHRISELPHGRNGCAGAVLDGQHAVTESGYLRAADEINDVRGRIRCRGSTQIEIARELAQIGAVE